MKSAVTFCVPKDIALFLCTGSAATVRRRHGPMLARSELDASRCRRTASTVTGRVGLGDSSSGARAHPRGRRDGGGRRGGSGSGARGAPPCVPARLDATRRRGRVSPPPTPRVQWGSGPTPLAVWRRCGTRQGVRRAHPSRVRAEAPVRPAPTCRCAAAAMRRRVHPAPPPHGPSPGECGTTSHGVCEGR